MEQSEQDRLMVKFGFSAREARWIIKRAEALHIGTDDLVIELSRAFIKIRKCHFVILFVVVLYVFLDHGNLTMVVFLSYIFAYFVACLCITTQGPLIKSFKAYRVLRKK